MTGDQVPMQINPQEAYELSEVKIRRPKFVKLPYIPKKVDFFSLAGKTRLVRIWNENSLSDEIMFTGGDVGPSDAFVREQVSDFVQHYILQRARRLSSDKQTLYSQLVEMQFEKSNRKKNSQVYSTYEKYIKARNEHVDRNRSLAEMERVKRLQLSGQTKVSPPDEVLQNPVYRVKRLLDKLRLLDKQEFDIKIHPLSIDIYSNGKIKVLHEPSLKNKKKRSIKQNSEESLDVPSEPLAQATTAASSLSRTRVAQSRSSSSGFHDMTSPVSSYDSKSPCNPPSTSASRTSRNVSYPSYSRKSEVGALHFISMVSEASDEDISLISEDSVC